MSFQHPFQIIGFHSCDREVGLRIINGKDQLRPSNNPWDWLGPGAYFWEDNPHRALGYAIKCASRKQKFSGRIINPFVIGAIIELGKCLNLIEQESIDTVKKTFDLFKKAKEEAGDIMPSNKGANRALDCAVIKYLHETNTRKGISPYETIRSPFQEGGQLYETANFTDGLHMEVCVINVKMIKGYFLPQPVEEFNPWLDKDFPSSKS
jgi:hypothetical protein